uniref:Uncharacterized protein n=1 Tax=Anguilla anguilla TaxID=7936 RepID=A0A0E9WSV8_ANGAN
MWLQKGRKSRGSLGQLQVLFVLDTLTSLPLHFCFIIFRNAHQPTTFSVVPFSFLLYHCMQYSALYTLQLFPYEISLNGSICYFDYGDVLFNNCKCTWCETK